MKRCAFCDLMACKLKYKKFHYLCFAWIVVRQSLFLSVKSGNSSINLDPEGDGVCSCSVHKCFFSSSVLKLIPMPSRAEQSIGNLDYFANI